jgi:hypothetical protein
MNIINVCAKSNWPFRQGEKGVGQKKQFQPNQTKPAVCEPN